MFPYQQKFSEFAKAGLESGFAFYATLGTRALESAAQLSTLNLAAARASLDESSEVARQMLAAKDPQEWMALVSAQLKPNAEKAIAYGKHVADIASNSRNEIGTVAELQVAEAGRKLHALVDEAARQAPPGVDSLVSIAKSVLERAADGYDQLAQAGKQAAEVMEVNLNAAARQFAGSTGLNV